MSEALIKLKPTVSGRARLGVQVPTCTDVMCCFTPVSPSLTQAYADAMLIIPKVLAQNAGFDPQETMVKLQEAAQTTGLHACLSHHLHSFTHACARDAYRTVRGC